MARDNLLAADLARLAEDERNQLGKPTVEQLVALRDGELSESEADRLRDLLARDPESAALYLELKRFPARETGAEGTTPGFDTEADVAKAWQELAPKLGQTRPSDADRGNATGEVVPFSRRGAMRVLLGVAATLGVGLGIAWWIGQAGHQLPDGGYYEIPVIGDKFRDPRERVPAGFVGLAFQIDLSGRSGSYLIELLDAENRTVRAAETFEAGQEVDYRVARRDLVNGATYQLHVRRRGETPILTLTIIPEFAD